MPNRDDQIEVFNVNHPGRSSFVSKDKYKEVKRVLKDYMPDKSPGLTQDEMASLVIEHVSGKVFEDRTKAGWWMKSVQLDLEAREVMIRENSRPLRWHYDTMKEEQTPAATESNVIRKKVVLDLPGDIKTILLAEDLLDAYENRPFYQRNDYLHWIASAKREETKVNRTRQMLEELRSGNMYMNMEYTAKR
jgi:hypothetical protein